MFVRHDSTRIILVFLGLGGLGPEYLLHAAGPASTLASSEFPFSIDGKICSNICVCVCPPLISTVYAFL